MEKACTKLRNKMLDCLLTKTVCVQEGGSIQECLRRPDLPEECKKSYNRYVECRRGAVDNRNRLSGNPGQY